VHRSFLYRATAAGAVSAVAVLGPGWLPASAAPAARAGTLAATAPASLAPALDGTAAGGSVIVILKDQYATLKLRTRSAARVTATRSAQRPVVASIRASGGTHVTRLVSVNAVAATVSAAEVGRLRRDPAVKEIVPDSVIPVPVSTPVPQAKNPAPLSRRLCPANPKDPLLEPEALGVIHYDTGRQADPDQADAIADGAGVLVAIDGMNELAGNPDLIRPDGSHVVIDSPTPNADASDDEAYGDASSVAGQGDVVYDYAKELPFSGLPAGCTFTIQGDAPGASLIDASLVDTPTDPDGFIQQTESQLIQGLDNAVVTEHADVISESFGFTQRPGRYAAFYAANDAAVAAGVTVVVSSGDSGDSGTVSSPATDPQVIAAGATNTLRLMAQAYGYANWTNNDITPLSSGGTSPNNKIVDLVAPGYGGEAECNPAGSGCPANTTTEAFGGTSEAAPLVAGAAADVIQAYAATHGGTKPTPAQVKEALTGTAQDIDAPAGEQGAGLVDIYAAVRAAQQLPGSTQKADPGPPSLIPSPTQLDVTASGRTRSTQQVTLYNTGATRTRVTGAYRTLGRAVQLGRTVTEPVSAPDPSLPVPAAGAQAAAPIRFAVPPGLSRLNADMIVPDPQNGTILSYTLVAPGGNLTQISYDFGTPSASPTGIGSTPNIQHVEVADPTPGVWTAKILWANGRAHLQSPPNAPGSFTGSISFRITGQRFGYRPALAPVTIPAHSSVTVPLAVSMPAQPGDHPESVQLTADNGATASLPITRRTLIPSAGGRFDATITSTVGRQVGQISTYDVSVAPGERDIDVSFATADASPDNKYTYFLLNPSGTVVAQDATPTTTLQGATVPVADADLVALDPAPGLWEIDVELNLTTSGQEFTQVVHGSVAFNQLQVSAAGLPGSAATVIPAGSAVAVSLSVRNTANTGRSFTVRSAAGDLSGGAVAAPVYLWAGQTGPVTVTLSPAAAAGTVVQGTLDVVSNTSIASQTQVIAAIPYAYTVGPPAS
jgi:Subtilase family